METFDVSKLNALAFEAINQKGNGDMDRYIYQDGQGLGSFFGSLMKRALPLLGKTIKGAARIAKPHLKKAATELANSAIKEGSNQLEQAIHRQHKKIKINNKD